MDRQDFMGLYESYMGVYEQDEYIEEDVEEIDEELTGSRLRRANQRIAQIDADLKKPGNKTNTDLWAKRARLRAVSGNAEGSSVAGTRAPSWEPDYKGPRGRGGRGIKGGPKTVGQSSSLDRPSGGTTSDSIMKGIRRHDKKSINASYEYDLYDLVLEYLLDEGLCESVENAEIMMAHMSEGWVESIIDEANEIMSITSPEGKGKKVNRTYPSGRANQTIQSARKLSALQKRQALNPRAMGKRTARAQASDEVDTNLRKSIFRLNADPNADVNSNDQHDSVSSMSKAGYDEVPTDYRARKRRASGR
jgi:hypothetical protein